MDGCSNNYLRTLEEEGFRNVDGGVHKCIQTTPIFRADCEQYAVVCHTNRVV